MFEPPEKRISIESPYSFKKYERFASFDEFERRMQAHTKFDYVHYVQRYAIRPIFSTFFLQIVMWSRWCGREFTRT